VGGDAFYDAVRQARTWFWSDPVRHRENRQDMRRAQGKVVAEALRRLGLPDDGLAADVANVFEDERTSGIKPFPGALNALSRLRELRIRMALVTNGGAGPQRAKVEAFGLARYFDTVLIEGELGFGKPDHRVYRMALERLSAQPAEAWIVGDNLDWEVAVPQQLGICAVWHDPVGGGLPPDAPARPDRIIRSLSELVS
jgi:putative hydrolase of the HAD superfamily